MARVLLTVRQVLQVIALFTILFTKRIPRGLFDMIVMTIRYRWRVDTYALWMRESYSRWLPLVKWLLAIPHYFVLLFLYLGAFFVVVGAFFAVLFTGRYPEGLRSYLIGVNRWSVRVLAYAGFLRDEYPPFSLS